MPAQRLRDAPQQLVAVSSHCLFEKAEADDDQGFQGPPPNVHRTLEEIDAVFFALHGNIMKFFIMCCTRNFNNWIFICSAFV